MIATKENIFPKKYRGRLTEGVTYDYRTNSLLWIDIIAGEVHRINATDGTNHEILKWESPTESIGAIGLTSNPDIILVCSKYGVAYGNFINSTLEYFFKYPHDESQQIRLRSNDGIIDPWGNLWIGVMNDFKIAKNEGIQPEGGLYRITPDLKFEKMIGDALILNGLGFNEKGDEFYWTDSLTFKIWKFSYDKSTNKLSNKQPLIDLKELYPDIESPEPDGFVMTEDGDIYTCIFSSGTILHVNNKGEEIERIKIDNAKRITCITTGGENNDTFYITTGHLELETNDELIPDANNESDDDLGGFLFKIETKSNLKGQKKNIWGGKI